MPTISVKISKNLRDQLYDVDWELSDFDHVSEFLRDLIHENIGRLPKKR